MQRHFYSRLKPVVQPIGCWIIFLFCSCEGHKDQPPIDRMALVSRHNVILQEADTLGSLSVGNGEFAFTVDVSGLQSFPKEYERGISLGTQSQWGWHSSPQKKNFTLKDVARDFGSCDSTVAPYAIQHPDGEAKVAADALRASPHRLHLGLIGLILLKQNGEEVKLSDLKKIEQRLDLWTGKIESMYEVDGIPVRVELYGHPEQDQIAVRITSALIQQERLRIKFDFPYGAECHVCPGYDFTQSNKHTTISIPNTENSARLTRILDSTTFYIDVRWYHEGRLHGFANYNYYELRPFNTQEQFEFTVQFRRDSVAASDDYTATADKSIRYWKDFWNSGGAIDFSECIDPRAFELERRVVLSQYLTKIQCAGTVPPQETGLTMNSWYGKFHLEMHWWHAAQFALWGRPELLEKSMGWYNAILPEAQSTARWQHYAGARWPKMTDPSGHESPSSVGAFIIWQQPHPIYFADLLYRAEPTKETLLRYKDLVFDTADFMASFVRFYDGHYHLCHPLIPAQEIFKATETDDPAFELQYWYYGLVTAQQWKEKLGLPGEALWDKIIKDLAPLTIANGLYLPNATTPQAYEGNIFRRDHPAVVGVYGMLPFNDRIDKSIMSNTLDNIMANWQWKTTWGWDYPLLAMSAARVGKPEMAIDALLKQERKNTYLVNGHNYQDQRLRLYLPGNGGLLAAVAMMAAGWDGSKQNAPGFPKNGKWNVRWEGLKKMP